MAKTSVLIDNYNNGPYLRACVDSVLSQTQHADEVIVYDDGSTDESLAILRGYGAQITLIAGERTGASSRAAQANAIYQAFLRSSGDLVFLLDGDDRFHPRKIEAYAKAYLSQARVVLVQAPLEQISETGAPLGSNYEPMKHKTDYLSDTYRLNDADFYYPTSGLAFSRTFLQDVLPLDFSDGIELPIDTRLGIIAPLFGSVVTLDTPYSDWRRHSRSYTVQTFPRTGQLKETLKRTRVFNTFCRQRGFRRIHVWRNRRFYLQLLRAATPNALYGFYYDRFRRTSSPQPQPSTTP
jgi:glycosyltransferase involved in cell wall biosynthesis